MKIFIISPNVDSQFSDGQKTSLTSAGDVHYVTTIQPLTAIAELFAGDEPRIVAIDPDFSDWSFPNEVIDIIPNLQAICLQTTSFSWLDVAHCTERNIPVVNLRGFSSIAVAEWATMLTLALARRVPVVARDNWKLDYTQHRGIELRGKTAGVIGLGRIGTAIAENFAGLGMAVQYWSQHSVDERFTKTSLEALVQTSDVIVSAVAHNADTETLLPDNLVQTMQPQTLLVDITHPIYNTELVLQLVADGKLGGYAFEDEKNPFGHYPGNVWNGPALGWCTTESMTKNTQQWLESIHQAAQGTYPTRVN